MAITIPKTLTCYFCNRRKPVEKFVRDKSRVIGYVRVCKACKKEDSARFRTENPGAARRYGRESKRRKRYAALGISEEGYQDLLSRQDGKCAICKKVQKARLAVDHDHRTGKVRGLLCTRCNQGLGYFKDSPIRLKSALTYLTGQVTLS